MEGFSFLGWSSFFQGGLWLGLWYIWKQTKSSSLKYFYMFTTDKIWRKTKKTWRFSRNSQRRHWKQSMDIIMVSASLGKARGHGIGELVSSRDLDIVKKAHRVVVFFWWSEKGKRYTGWWQLKDFLFSPRNWGRWTHFDEHIFQMGGQKTANQKTLHFLDRIHRLYVGTTWYPSSDSTIWSSIRLVRAFCRDDGQWGSVRFGNSHENVDSKWVENSVTLPETNIAPWFQGETSTQTNNFWVPAVSFREGTTHFTPFFFWIIYF